MVDHVKHHFPYIELPAECDLLATLDRQLDVLVFRHIAKLFDPKTGTCGVTHAISHAFIAEALTDNHKVGRNRQVMTVTPKMVRSSIERLCQVGLFTRLSVQSASSQVLKLRRKLWTKALKSRSFAQNQLGSLVNWLWAAFDLNKSNDISDLPDDKNDKGTALGKPLGKYNIPFHSKPSANGSKNDQFKMSATWKPSADFQKQIMEQFKLSDEHVSVIKTKLFDFTMYWSQATAEMSQEAWERKFFRNELRLWLQRGAPLQVRKPLPAKPVETSGAAEPTVVKTPKSNNHGVSDAFRVPKTWDLGTLVAWAKRHGYPEAKEGMELKDWIPLLRRQAQARQRQAGGLPRG